MNERDLVILMFGAGIIRFPKEGEGFQWKLHRPGNLPNAPLAPLKIEFRTKVEDSPERQAMVKLVTQRAGQLIAWNFHARNYNPFPSLIAGVPNVGCRLAEAAAVAWRGLGPSGHPKLVQALIKDNEGAIRINQLSSWPSGFVVGLVDDVLSLGHSVIDASVAIAPRYAPKVVAVVVDYDLGARQSLEKSGTEVFSVLKVSSMLSILQGAGLVSGEKVMQCFDWFKQIRLLTDAARV